MSGTTCVRKLPASTTTGRRPICSESRCWPTIWKRGFRNSAVPARTTRAAGLEAARVGNTLPRGASSQADKANTMRPAASAKRSGSKSHPAPSRASQGTLEPADQASRLPHSGIQHILVCVDGTDNDQAVLDQVLQVALRFGSHIDVLHVRFDVHGATVESQERRIDCLFDKPV